MHCNSLSVERVVCVSLCTTGWMSPFRSAISTTCEVVYRVVQTPGDRELASPMTASYIKKGSNLPSLLRLVRLRHSFHPHTCLSSFTPQLDYLRVLQHACHPAHRCLGSARFGRRGSASTPIATFRRGEHERRVGSNWHSHSPVLIRYSSEQGTSLISTGWLGSAKKSNDGLALIARSLFDTYQDPSENYTPFTNNEASPAPGDARAANVAPEVEEAEPTSISSIESTTTTQEEPKSSVATPSAVDVPLPSSDQPKVAEQNWYPYYWDWVRPRAIVPVRKH